MRPQAEFYFASRRRVVLGAKIPNPSKHAFTVSVLWREVALVPVKHRHHRGRLLLVASAALLP